MLALNSPVFGQGCWQSSAKPAYEVITRQSETQNSGVLGEGAVARTLAEIDKLCTIFLRNEDTPTAIAHETATRLLSEAQTIAPIYIGASTLEGFEGDLLIHWDTPHKSVVLICPATDEKSAQIYSELLDGRNAVQSKLIQNVTSQDLSTALSWVLQPQN